MKASDRIEQLLNQAYYLGNQDFYKFTIYLNGENISLNNNFDVDNINFAYYGFIECNDIQGLYNYSSGWDANSGAISGYLTQAESLLSQVEQINNVQSYNASLNSQNSSLVQELTGLNQRIAEMQNKIDTIQNQVDSFDIATTINPMTAREKAHILQKSWQQTDELSKSLVSVIKSQEFDPHYVNKEGLSLAQSALSSDDDGLFDLLINKGLKFEKAAKVGKSFFAIVQESGKDSFMHKMIATKQDFGKDLVRLATEGDDAKLKQALDLDASLAKSTYQGSTLLQTAILAKKQQIVEIILEKDSSTVDQLSSNNVSAYKIALATNNEAALDSLVAKGLDLKVEMIKHLKKNQESSVKKLLNLKPNLLSDVVKDASEDMVKDLFSANHNVFKIADGNGKNLLDYAVSHINLPAIKVMIMLCPEFLSQQIDGKNLLHHILLMEDITADFRVNFFKAILDLHVELPNLDDMKDDLDNNPELNMIFEEYGVLGENMEENLN
jgi:hypothetical protein